MKLIVSSNSLLRSLQMIYGVINPTNTLPILDDFLFDLKENVLKVTASDLETTMSVILTPTMSEDPGIVAIPAKLLMDTLKTLPDIPITFTIDEHMGIEISTDGGRFKLAGHPGDEFPNPPVLDDSSVVTVKSHVLASAFKHTLFAAGNDELRQVMTGIFCDISTSDVTFVATDAHKLVRYRRVDMHPEQSASFILPRKPLNQLKNILPDDVPVKVEYNKTNARFIFENVDMVCRLIEGKYPNYEAVIPKDNPNILIIDRISMMQSIKRVSLYANQSTNQLRLVIHGQELLLSAEDIDFSNEAKERLSCSYDGADIEIGFNSKFLVDMLNNIVTPQVRMEFSTPNRAGLLLPVDTENKEEDILMLVMPVMLNQ